MEQQAEKERLEFWEARFPGKGAAIFENIRRFHGWSPDFRPPIKHIEQCAKEAIFWRPVSKVIVATLLTETCFDFIREPSKTDLAESFWDADMRTKEVGDSHSDEEVDTICASVASALKESNPSIRTMRALGMKAETESFFGALYLPCMYIALGFPQLAAKFKPLQDLWLAYNWPVAINKQGALYVLVGPPTN